MCSQRCVFSGKLLKKIVSLQICQYMRQNEPFQIPSLLLLSYHTYTECVSCCCGNHPMRYMSYVEIRKQIGESAHSCDKGDKLPAKSGSLNLGRIILQVFRMKQFSLLRHQILFFHPFKLKEGAHTYIGNSKLQDSPIKWNTFLKLLTEHNHKREVQLGWLPQNKLSQPIISLQS